MAAGPVRAGDWYRASLPAREPEPALEGVQEAATCIIGGGFAGLHTALGLAERAQHGTVVLEAAEIGHGASGRNGGFVFGGYSRGEGQLLAELGAERARRVYAGSLKGVELVRERVKRYAIPCHMVEQGVLWANWFRDPAPLRERQRLLAEHFDVDWRWVPREELRQQVRSTRYHDALFEPNALHLHPLSLARGLAAAAAGRGVRVFERSPALSVEKRGRVWRVRTPAGEVHARRVVMACGGYLAGLRREVDAAVLPIATYVMATAPIPEALAALVRTQAAVYDSRFAFDYWRTTHDGRLLWGGRISVRDRDPAAVQRLLRRDLARVFPVLADVPIDFAWSGLMGYARHEMPHVLQPEPNLWLVQAFGGHGLATTAYAGDCVAAAIAEADQAWKDFAAYPLGSAFKPAGLLAAQAGYWWRQGRDAWKDWRERAAS
jgi:gamma-glutamylputrescine oxidase